MTHMAIDRSPFNPWRPAACLEAFVLLPDGRRAFEKPRTAWLRKNEWLNAERRLDGNRRSAGVDPVCTEPASTVQDALGAPGMNFSATPFRQWRLPVGFGPSSKM